MRRSIVLLVIAILTFSIAFTLAVLTVALPAPVNKQPLFFVVFLGMGASVMYYHMYKQAIIERRGDDCK